MTVAPPSHPGWRPKLPESLRGVAAPFELEDLLLVVWVLLLERALMWYLGAGREAPLPIEQAVFRTASSSSLGPAGEPHWLLAILGQLTVFGWVIVAGLLFVIVTRGREDRTLDTWIGRRFLLVPPPLFYGLHVLAFLAWIVARMLGHAPGPHPQRRPGAGAGDDRIAGRSRSGAEDPVASLDDPARFEAPSGEPVYWGPAAPRTLRRLAVVPAALLGESAFRAQILSLGSGFGSELTLSTMSLAALRAAGGADLFQLALETVLLAGAFAFLVAGPRIAAGSTLAWQAWVARFAMFAAATVAAARVPVA